jgi:hypothetical protein
VLVWERIHLSQCFMAEMLPEGGGECLVDGTARRGAGRGGTAHLAVQFVT